MNKRPRVVTVISWIFIVFGIISVGANVMPLLETVTSPSASQLKSSGATEFWLILVVRLLAIVSGVLMLYGSNWGRWLLVTWFGYHIILSVFHSPMELLAHIAIFAVVLYFLFGRAVTAYYQGMRADEM